MNPNPILSIPEAADILGIGRTKLYDLIATGDLRAVKIGRRTMIRRDDLDTYIATLPSHNT